jgi:iron complex outermembrane receptor protein
VHSLTRYGTRSTPNCSNIRFPASLLALGSLIALPASAQRADENAIVAASDAFGTSIGQQTIGLYSPTSARGFNPTQAGNLRIEGLYFDQQTSSFNSALFSGSEMRIGIAAQSYRFPSPTGIADYKLRAPGDLPLLSVTAIRGPFEGASLQIDTQIPITETLAMALSVADQNDFDYNTGRRSMQYESALVLRFRPNEHVEVLPFIGYVGGTDHRMLPFVFADGVHPLPLFEERNLASQDWSSWGWGQTTAGIIARGDLGGAWSMTTGVFRSIEADRQSFNDLLLALMPNRTGDHVIDVVSPLRSSSSSGELRLTRRVSDGEHQHELQFAARARQVERHYGGDSVTDFGSVSIDHSISIPEPALLFTPSSRDLTRQTGVGVNYVERWNDVGTVNVGVLKTRYSRSIMSPGAVIASEDTATTLPTVSFTLDAGRKLTLYGSYTRGLEDSVPAPNSAVNRGEPPPATPTWQIDAGLKAAPYGNLQLVLGVFDIHKAYFNVDLTDRYARLGEVSNRGIEASATMTAAAGLSIVAGFVLSKPEVERTAAQLSAAGTVPVGPVPRTINVNVDYAPTALNGWAASLQWTSLSSRVETDSDAYALPPLETLNAGLRYARKLFSHASSLRFDVANLTNAAGLTISPQYSVLPQIRRNYTLTFTIDI